MKFFGTDGIRGVVGNEISPKTAFLIGYAVAKIFGRTGKNGHIIVGKDTRMSGDVLVSALSSGICFAGMDVLQVGVLPSAAISFLTKKYAGIAGVMVTGSHNGPECNGFMIFDCQGFKIGEEAEREIEKFLRDEIEPKSSHFGQIFIEQRGRFDYLEFLKNAAYFDLSGLCVSLDLCHGAACGVADKAFETNGAKVILHNEASDGEQVNVKCGPQDISRFCGAVVRTGADVGFSFDADADRIVAVDEKGKVVDGDKILFLFATFLAEETRLLKNTVVGTILSSISLEHALAERGIFLVRSCVGEQKIVSELERNGFVIGGEKAGKLILRDYLPSADGILVALFVAKIMQVKDKKLSELVDAVKDLPQEQKNFIMDKNKKIRLESDPQFLSLLDRILQNEKKVRIVARASGTEDVFRVLVESNSANRTKRVMRKIEQFVLNFS